MESVFIYSKIIDPVLGKIRKKVSAVIPPQKKVLDVACGTGAQVFELAGKSAFVTGIDHAYPMIERAEKLKLKKHINNIAFKYSDVTLPFNFSDRSFDIAVMTLALHQFAPENYAFIIMEMKRVAGTIVFVDYKVPNPGNLQGFGIRIAEYFAGKEHYRNYRKYNRRGGITGIAYDYGLKISHEEFFARGVFHLAVCS